MEGTDDTNGVSTGYNALFASELKGSPAIHLSYANGIIGDYKGNIIEKRILLKAEKSNLTHGYQLRLYVQPEYLG